MSKTNSSNDFSPKLAHKHTAFPEVAEDYVITQTQLRYTCSQCIFCYNCQRQRGFFWKTLKMN